MAIYANFKRVNPHPQKKLVGDCVKRAICLASGINYHDIAIMLNRYRKTSQTAKFNSRENWKGFIVHILLGRDQGNMQYACCGHRYTIERYAHNTRTKAIVQASHHIVCCNGKGQYLDTWDSGEKSIYKVWNIPSYETIVEHIKKNYPKLCKGLTLERINYETL